MRRQRVKWRHALRRPRRGKAALLLRLPVLRRWAPALNHALPSTLSHVGEWLLGHAENRAKAARRRPEPLHAAHSLMLRYSCGPNPGAVQVPVGRHGPTTPL